jgi:transcription antitermination protein NusB
VTLPYRALRQAVVETLYESENSDHPPHAVLERRLAELAEEDAGVNEQRSREFAARALAGVMERKDETDELIAEAAPRYPVSSMAVIDRNILRLAIWELLSDTAASVAAVVNEAVELAHRYGGEKSPAFVNGVLRTVSSSIVAGRAATPPAAADQDPTHSHSRRSTS